MTETQTRVQMRPHQIATAIENGAYQCVVEARSDGSICWDIADTRDREPVHQVKKGDRFWCWSFRESDGVYFHDYGNMAPQGVAIKTDVELTLVYVTDDPEDSVLFDTSLEKSPNWS